MTFLLKLKHWQLFVISWGGPMLFNTFTFSRPEIWMATFPVLMVLFSVGTLGWVWAIATGLHHLLPAGVNLNLRRFKILFLIPGVYILLIVLMIPFAMHGSLPAPENMTPAGMAGLLVFVHLLSLCIIIWGLRFAAKTLKSIILGRTASFGDCVGEFFLIWFSIVGYWELQPKLNRLISQAGSRPV